MTTFAAIDRPRRGAPGRRPLHLPSRSARAWRSWLCGTSRADTLCRWNFKPGGSPTRGAVRSLEASENERRSAIDAYRALRGTSQKSRMNLVALAFARAAGVEPHLETGRTCDARCCSVPSRRVVSGSKAPMRYPMRPYGSRARPPPSARSRRTSLTERERSYWSLVEAAARRSGLSRHDAPRAQVADLVSRQAKAAQDLLVVLPQQSAAGTGGGRPGPESS